MDGAVVSVIIPARNEENNLPHLLRSIGEQTRQPDEVIVVDDFSADATARIAREFGAVVIENAELPDGWTGKTWAVWNGYLRSKGDILIFLDSDVRLSPRALECLLASRARSGGTISVVPYHHTEKFYERLSLLPFLMGVFAFTSPFERKYTRSLYGSCVVTTRENYERVSGHDSIRGELLDDMNLGKKFAQAGVRVENFIGRGLVSFRMYSGGIKDELQGFGKGAVLSTAQLRTPTTVLIAIWLIGLLAAEFATPLLFFLCRPFFWPFAAGYAAYTVQILFFLFFCGRYGSFVPLFHVLSSLFFLVVLAYSFYQVAFVGSVSWKGRQVSVRRHSL